MIAKTCRDNLAVLIRAYRAGTGASMSAVSKRHYGNGGFLTSYLAGVQSMSIEKYEAVVEGIRSAWPPDTAWPSLRAIILQRPDPETAENATRKKVAASVAAAAKTQRKKSFPQKST